MAAVSGAPDRGTRFGCAVCRRPLNRFDLDGQVHWLHAGAGTGAADHPAQPVPADQITQLLQVCDFCCDPDPVWLYRTPPLTLQLLTDDGELRNQLGDRWLACGPCADLIDADDGRGLLHRAQTGPAAGANPPSAEVGAIQAAFLRSRRPGRDRLHPTTPSSAGLRPAQLPKARDRLGDWWRQHASDGPLRRLTEGDPPRIPAHLVDPPRHHGTTAGVTSPSDIAAYTQAMAGALSHAALYWIDPVFTDLAIRAGQDLPDLVIPREQVPADSGLLVWGIPIAAITVPNFGPQQIVAAQWWRIPTGWWLQFYGNAGQHLTGLALQRTRERLGWLMPLGAGHALPDDPDDLDERCDPALELEHDMTETLIATWLLSGQPLAEDDTEPADKATRRAYARAKRPPPDVRLIRLRGRHHRDTATSSAPGDRPARTYSHQWWVAGHWRDQRHGPKRGLTKRIYIAGHLAGPDDKPVRLRPSVRVLGNTKPAPDPLPSPSRKTSHGAWKSSRGR